MSKARLRSFPLLTVVPGLVPDNRLLIEWTEAFLASHEPALLPAQLEHKYIWQVLFLLSLLDGKERESVSARGF